MKKGLTFFMKQQEEQKQKTYNAIMYTFLLEDMKNALNADLEVCLNYQLCEQLNSIQKKKMVSN